MTSQTFSLGEDGKRGVCTKILLVLIMVAVVGAAVIVGIFAFNTSQDETPGCSSPSLDPNGLSNFSVGAETIAFACFPGFFADSSSPEATNVIISHCEDNEWNPLPPTCNFLPLRLDCTVANHGLEGEISVVQMNVHEATNIFGSVNYINAIKSEGHINEIIPLSRSSSNCRLSQDYNITADLEAVENNEEEYTLKISFESKQLAAYKNSQIHVNMIFLDVNTTATIISCHQDNLTLVMQNEVPSTGWTTKEEPGE